MSSSRRLDYVSWAGRRERQVGVIPVTGGGDEVKKCVDTIISESWITLDTALFGQDIIILAFQMPNDFREGSFVVDLITEAWCIDDGKRYTGPFLI